MELAALLEADVQRFASAPDYGDGGESIGDEGVGDVVKGVGDVVKGIGDVVKGIGDVVEGNGPGGGSAPSVR